MCIAGALVLTSLVGLAAQALTRTVKLAVTLVRLSVPALLAGFPNLTKDIRSVFSQQLKDCGIPGMHATALIVNANTGEVVGAVVGNLVIKVREAVVLATGGLTNTLPALCARLSCLGPMCRLQVRPMTAMVSHWDKEVYGLAVPYIIVHIAIFYRVLCIRKNARPKGAFHGHEHYHPR